MHRRTDPACKRYKEPRGPLGRWLFERGRGRPCRTCYPQTMDTATAEAWLADLEATYGPRTPGVPPKG